MSNEDDIQILSSLFKSKSLQSIIRKISSFKDKKSLIEAIKRLLSNQIDGNFDKILLKIKETGASIIHQDIDNDIIICMVDYDQIVKLGSDTSWCIVRSISTFNSYAHGRLQYIIFLLDQPDRLSKIGFTCSFDYYTAHDKYDGYVSKVQLYDILKERNFDITKLFYTKEIVSKMDWSNIPISSLTNLGFTNSEIASKRKHFNNVEILMFSKDELEEYNILSKTSFNYENLKRFTKDFIIKHNLLDTCGSRMSISHLIELGFTKDEILTDKLFNKKSVFLYLSKDIEIFTKSELLESGLINRCRDIHIENFMKLGFTKSEIIEKYSDFVEQGILRIIKFFSNKKTKKEIISRLSDTFWNEDWINIGLPGSVSDTAKFNKLLDVIQFYEISTKELPLYKLKKGEIDYRNNMSLCYIIYRHNLKEDNNCIRRMIDMGYDIKDENDYKAYIHMFSIAISDRYILRMTSFSTNFSENKLVLNFISNDISNYIDKSNNRYRMEYNYVINNETALSNFPVLQKQYLSSVRKSIIADSYSVRQRENMSTDFTKTINLLKKFNITKKDNDNIKYWEDIFSDAKTYNFLDILNYMKSIGFDFNEEQAMRFIKAIGRYENDVISKSKFFIDNKICIDVAYNEILAYLKTRNSLDKRDESKLDELSYGKWASAIKEAVSDIKNRELKISICEELKKCISSHYGGSYSIDDWYKKYFNEYLKYGFVRDKGELNFYLIILLFAINKIEDLDKIKDLNFMGRGLTFDDCLLHSVCKFIILGKGTKIFIDDNRKKELYNWVIENVDESNKEIQRILQVCYFIYDKEKYTKYINNIINTKGNIQYLTKAGNIRKETLRIKGLKYIISYFANKGMTEEFKDIIQRLSDSKMGKIERKATIDFLRYIDIPHTDRDKLFKLSNNILNNLKESFILKWSEFTLKRSFPK